MRPLGTPGVGCARIEAVGQLWPGQRKVAVVGEPGSFGCGCSGSGVRRVWSTGARCCWRAVLPRSSEEDSVEPQVVRDALV